MLKISAADDPHTIVGSNPSKQQMATGEAVLEVAAILDFPVATTARLMPLNTYNGG